MSFHSNNYDCRLSIGSASSTVGTSALPAYNSDVFSEVGMTGKIKLPNFEKSVGRFNVLNTPSKYAVGGKLGDQMITADIVLDNTDPTHTALFNDVKIAGNVWRNIKVVTPTGEVWLMQGFLSKWERDEYNAEGDAKEIHVNLEFAISGSVQVT